MPNHNHHHDEHECACSCEHCHMEHEHDGCECCHHHHGEEKPIKQRLIPIIFSGVLILASFFIPNSLNLLKLILLLVAYLTVGIEPVVSAAKELVKEHQIDEEFLMSIASIGAIAVGEYTEAVAVMLFYALGEILEEVAQARSKKSIRALMELHPDVVNVKRDGKIIKVQPEEVNVSDTVVLYPGERVALDGKIVNGEASVDYSALTGESLPVSLTVGDEIYGGGINLSTAVEMVVTKPYKDSSSARIIALVEDARSKKAKSEKFISKFAKKYTLAVCLIAAVVAFIVPIFAGNFARWLYTGLTFLVVSCPCALVISVPLTFFAGLGCASTHGILIKSTASIETLAKLKSVALDKTGTVTKGTLSVSRNTLDDESLILCACAESRSTHPIAKAVVSYCGKDINDLSLGKITEIAGKGVKAIVNGREVSVGNLSLMADDNISVAEPAVNGVCVHVAVDGEYKGFIALADEVKPDSAKAVAHLKELGVSDVVMLTGDSSKTANEVCETVGIDEVYTSLTPEGKCKKLEDIVAHTALDNRSTAFVGDGINDAPVLSMADVGVAMGGLGSDAAIETADVVILNDSLSKLPLAVKISRHTMTIVRENIIISLAIKIGIMVLSLLNLTGMWLAVFADIGVMLLAVLNSLRALKFKE